jgi:mannose-1-phosphate guanylyltransferase
MKVATTKLALPSVTVGLIYAGGYGTRLWPVSTAQEPKQINPVFTGRPLVHEAYERARKMFKEEDIFIVVTRGLFAKTFRLLGIPRDRYIIQPENADTAIAMGLAALYIECLKPGAVAVTIYSDQTVSDISAYKEAVQEGVAIARTRRELVTVGTIPEYPATQFGYIELGKRLRKNVYQSSRFIEKPAEHKAKRLVASGKYVWNTGLYIWEVGYILSLFKEHAADLYEVLLALRAEFFSPRFERELLRLYSAVRRTSFDLAISEKLRHLAVVVSRYQWSDVGTWKIVYELAKKDRRGNALIGEKPRRFIPVSAANCLVRSDKKIVALVGVSDVYVIETKDTLLVCSAQASGSIKEVVAQAECE